MTNASTNPYAPPLTDINSIAPVQKTFCGLQPLWTRLDRFYKFYITNDALFAGWIGGQFHDKLSVRYQLSPLYLVLVGFVVVEPLAAWISRRRQQLEDMYDSLICNPDGFLPADSRNIAIHRTEITSIAASRRKVSWTVWANSGILEVKYRNHGRLRIFVRDSRDLDSIMQELIAAGYPAKLQETGFLSQLA